MRQSQILNRVALLNKELVERNSNTRVVTDFNPVFGGWRINVVTIENGQIVNITSSSSRFPHELALAYLEGLSTGLLGFQLAEPREK